jgi:hypothetical protein
LENPKVLAPLQPFPPKKTLLLTHTLLLLASHPKTKQGKVGSKTPLVETMPNNSNNNNNNNNPPPHLNN